MNALVNIYLVPILILGLGLYASDSSQLGIMVWLYSYCSLLFLLISFHLRFRLSPSFPLALAHFKHYNFRDSYEL
jgi:hypothetical protein